MNIFMDQQIALITGSTRGIGKAIALKLAQQGYLVVITGKTKNPHAKLKGTIDEVVEEINSLGYSAVGFQLDVRDDDQLENLFIQLEKDYGRLDVLVNNASAISLTTTEQTTMKKYDLMQNVNGRGTFACSKMAFPLLRKSKNPHILVMSPPLSFKPRWFERHVAYTLSKYMMSLCVIGLSAEFKKEGIAVNALWPKSIIATSAIEFNFPKELLERARTVEIVADAAWEILKKPCDITGQFFIDEVVLKNAGIEDFSRYAINPKAALFPDLYLD
jgi:citronellol/citronellal dehydrogenase